MSELPTFDLPVDREFASETLAWVTPAWEREYEVDALACESRRPFCRKPAVTGTINRSGCLYLRAICKRFLPRVVVEIGTFIGSSALAMAYESGGVFTCDKDNDAFASQRNVVAYPKTTSTEMLARLVSQGTKASLFFFDGRIHENDVPLIQLLSAPGAIYAFDDYVGHEKGVVNLTRLAAHLKGYRIVLPPRDTMIACLVPA